MSVNQITSDNDTATYTCSQSDNDKVFHTTCCSVSHFTDCSSIGVVSQCNGNTADLFADQLCQRYFTFPWKVRGKFDTTVEEVAVRSSYADTFDFVRTSGLVDY